jgi:hypothetical protein
MQGIQSGGFRFEDIGAFFVIYGTQNWKQVLVALNLDPNKAVQGSPNNRIFTVRI